MKTTILTVTMVIALSCFGMVFGFGTVIAQEREAPQLPLDSLGWSGTSADSVTDFDHRGIIFGWNWLSTDSNVSHTLGCNAWHLHDPYAFWPTSSNWEYGAARVPQQRLLSAIANLSTATNNQKSVFSLPCEAVAMEWQPWLVVAGDTAVLKSDDSTGGVWGFRGRHASGSVVTGGTDGYYRYRLETTDFTGQTLVLWDVVHKDALTRWPDPNPGFNTDTLWLAINLRRNDSSSDSGRLDEPVLRVRVPMWTPDPCPIQHTDSTMAKMRSIPSAVKPNDTVSSTLNEYVGIRRDTIQTALAPTELVITRRMLPAYGAAEPDITVYAMICFDWNPADTSYENKLWQNPMFVSHFGGSDKRMVDRVSINVDFTDELGVDIKSIRLESNQSRELFWGQRDSAIMAAVSTYMGKAIAYNRDSVAVPGDQGRLWRVYTRDEIRPMHWKGFRYINRLLHDRTTTEWNIAGQFSAARHCLRLKEYWQGTTALFHVATPSPVIRHGVTFYGGVQDSLRTYLGMMNGRDDWPDFETRLEVYQSYDCDQDGTADSVVQRKHGPLPIAADSLDIYCDSYTASTVGRAEIAAKFGYGLLPQMLFDTTITRFDNIWEYASFIANRDTTAGVLFLTHSSNARVKSAEEMRLQQWMPLVLGSKGLVHYYGTTQSAPDSIANGSDYWSWQPGQTQRFVDIGATHLIKDAVSVHSSGDARVDADSMGTDYVLQGDLSHLDKYMPFTMAATASALNSKQSNPPGVPVFRKSMRQVMREAWRGLVPYLDTLSDLYLTAWRGKGFRTWYLGDTVTYALWLSDNIADQRCFVPAQPDGTAMALPRLEDYDSTFYDITVLRHAGRSAASDCYIGLLNRRTDPRLGVERWVDDDVLTYDGIKAHMKAHPEDLYKQYGARRLRLPFHYSGQSDRALNLRVQELRVADTIAINQRPPLDTIIGRDVPLDVDMLPGEGKIFHVTTVDASSSNGSGFLAHSNQRKLVAFPNVVAMVADTDYDDNGQPVRTYYRYVTGDTMRYHRVYHKRRDAYTFGPPPEYPLVVVPEGGALTVWYQRSSPLILTDTTPSSPGQYTFDASTVTWEEPINVSSRILYQAPEEEAPTIKDLSCGFPALVVRADTTGDTIVSKVYVVFGCEYDPTSVNRAVLVCESIIPAEVTHAEQQAYYNGDYSAVLDVTPATLLAGMVTQENFLEHWGTPMVNASAGGNYYGWSHALNGIGAGYKRPNQRTFVGGQTEYLHCYQGLYGSHPSLNSYSRLGLGEEDAGIIWQEGANTFDGNFIMMTRLRHDANDNIYHELTATTAPFVKGPDIIWTPDSTIAQLEDIYIDVNDVEKVGHHSYPVLYQHLSDWDITENNKYYSLGQVNNKAMRAFWQTRYNPGQLRWMIGRRNADFSDWTQGWSGATTDTIWSQSVNFIFSDSLQLQGPDIAQGEQWGEWGSDPEYPSWDYDDSTMVLEYWSDTSETDLFPRLWSMTLSWALYGSDVDYNHSTLVNDGNVRLVRDYGRYPHLAARYSMIGTNNAGWQRNRRIANLPGGIWPAYQQAPSLLTSSEYFYKPAGIGNEQPFSRRYRGYRGDEGWVVSSAFDFDVSKKRLQLEPASYDRQGVPERFSTSWLTLGDLEEVTVRTRALGEQAIAELMVERKSDGATFSMNAVASNQRGSTVKNSFTLIASRGEHYRFYLEPRTTRLWPAEDVEVGITAPETFAKEGLRRRIIDLRQMREYTPGGIASVLACPNPAENTVSIVVTNQTGTAEQNQTQELLVTVTNDLGNQMLTTICHNTDVLHVEVSSWPAGAYHVTVTSASGLIATTSFAVVR